MADNKKEKTDYRVLLRVFREARPIYGKLLAAAGMGALLVVMRLVQPELLGEAVQIFYDDASGTLGRGLWEALLPKLLLLAPVYVAASLLEYGKMRTLNIYTSRYYTCNMRIAMADKISRLPVSYIDKTPAGEIIDRMVEDMSNLGGTLHELVDTLTMGFLQLLATAAVMLLADWRLALAVLVLMPLSLLLSTKLSAKSSKYFDSMFAESGKLYAHVEESYANFETTRVYNREEDVLKAHREINERQKTAERKANFLFGVVGPTITLTNALAYVVLALLGGVLVVRKGVTPGTVVTLLLFARQLAGPLETIAQSMGMMRRVAASAKRVCEYLDAEEETPVFGSFEGEIRGHVRFEGLDFAYDPEKPLIQDLNADIESGRKVAIVGPTGAGKTTLVNLLMRFYDPQGGRITIDGQDIAQVSREEVRSLFGMVLQDTWLFEGTVADNIAYGRPGATREEIIRAADEAYCDHFIRTLPEGYDTKISEDSVNISGGQKQLLTIARALLADRKLLILDEATSHVDTRTEILLQKAMDRLMEGRTSFVIAHRLSTIVDADLILVIRDGQLVESGTHDSLLAQKGFYYELYSSQYAI